MGLITYPAQSSIVYNATLDVTAEGFILMLMEAKEPLGPPELPNSRKTSEIVPHLQLVQSTKTTLPETEIETKEEIYTEPDELNEFVDEPGDPDGVVAAEEVEQTNQKDSSPQQFAAKGKPRKKRWPLAFAICVVIAVAAVGAYWFGNWKAGKDTTALPTPSAAKPASQPKTILTKHYDSVTYTLSFDYPGDWIVSDTSSKLTVTSPVIALTGVDGSITHAHVIVTVQNQQTTIPDYPADGAVAELTSDKLSYVQPTAVQRAQTYISYLGYHKTNGLDQLFITGDNGYQQGQIVPMSDVIKGNPLVSVSFETCATNTCSTIATPLTLLASKWANTAASKQVTDLVQSLQLN